MPSNSCRPTTSASRRSQRPWITCQAATSRRLYSACEFGLAPQLMVAAQPTRGLDVGATESVRKLPLAGRHQQMAILLISTELEEILG